MIGGYGPHPQTLLRGLSTPGSIGLVCNFARSTQTRVVQDFLRFVLTEIMMVMGEDISMETLETLSKCDAMLDTRRLSEAWRAAAGYM